MPEMPSAPVSWNEQTPSSLMVIEVSVRRKRAIELFLRTGEYDPVHPAWPGDVLKRCRNAEFDLRSELVTEVRRRSEGKSHPTAADINYQEFARTKVEPMMRGFFPSREQEPVLLALEKSVVFLTAKNIEVVILGATYLHTAWVLANLYLGSLGVALLSLDAPRVVGLSEQATCYLSTAYLQDDGRFADILVHEAAHLFHNCRRRTIGLPESERKQWPLTIDFRKREEFAYACEHYSRLLALSSGRTERVRLVGEFCATSNVSDEHLNTAELISILEEAVIARNGWKRILARCSPDEKR